MARRNIYLYAPGDGSLAFRKYDGKIIKMWEARKFFKRSPKCDHLRHHQGWMLVNHLNQPTLIPNVFRVNATTLRWGNTQYNYTLIANIPMPYTHIAFNNVRFTINGTTQELKHFGTMLALCFFLAHEQIHYS